MTNWLVADRNPDCGTLSDLTEYRDFYETANFDCVRLAFDYRCRTIFGRGTMRIDLVELLRTRTIAHPSRFVTVESRCASDIRIAVAGFPWWFENPPADEDRQITFHFEEITEGTLDAEIFTSDPSNEDLELFDVRPLSELLWSKGAHCNLYCNGPLPNPLNVYAALHDFLLSVGCPYGPERYLNMGDGGSLSEYSGIATSKSFHLFRGPETICEVVCAEVEKSGTSFNTIKGRELSGNLIFAQIAQSHLICQSAFATFDDWPPNPQ